jgi:hypothetical protein
VGFHWCATAAVIWRQDADRLMFSDLLTPEKDFERQKTALPFKVLKSVRQG